MIEEKYAEITEKMLASVEPIARTGLKVVECRDWYVKLEMPLKGNTNHIGIMYAGVLFTLGEVAGGAVFVVAMEYEKYFAIVKKVNIKYIRPAMSEITLEVRMDSEEAKRIEKEVAEKGKSDFAMSLELKDINDDVVTLVEGVWQARQIPPGMTMPWS